MKLSESIARFRHERGMTQEALAELLGVSAQTISKWEKETTCPDVSLLPVIADVFGVSIDALYGRADARRSIPVEHAVDRVIDGVREVIIGTIYNPEQDGRFETQLAQYKRLMQTDARQRSVIETDRDVLYFREQVGAVALRRPEGGWSSLFGREAHLDVLRLLADEDFRRAMQAIISRRMLTFTLPALAKTAGIGDVDRLGGMLRSSGLFANRELLVDEAPLVYYELTGGEQRLYLLYAVLVFAQEFATYESYHYCFIGNMNYFTP